MSDNLLMGLGGYFAVIVLLAIYRPKYLGRTVACIRDVWDGSPFRIVAGLLCIFGAHFLAAWLLPSELFSAILGLLIVVYTVWIPDDVSENKEASAQ